MSRIITRKYKVDTHGKLSMNAVLITDVHERMPYKIAEKVRKCRPDVIFIAGDLIDYKRPNDDKRSPPSSPFILLRLLSEIAPVYYALGNHEAYIPRELIEKAADCGVCVLENSYEYKVINGHGFYIGGASPKDSDGFVRRFASLDGYRILLFHEPDTYMRKFAGCGVDIALAGHAHGGQWRIFGKAIYAPGQGLFPEYTRGMYGELLVSAGAVNSVPIPRIFNPCEIVFITFG